MAFLLCSSSPMNPISKVPCALASQVAPVGKNQPANAGDIRDVSSILGSGRSPGGGHDNLFQYSCWENLMNRGTWQATVHGVAKSQTPLKQLSTWYSTCTFSPTHIISSCSMILASSISLDKSPFIFEGSIKQHSFYLWGFPRVPRVSHRSIRATRYFLQILLRPLLSSGDRGGRAFTFPSPKPRLEFHSFKQVHLASGVEWMNTQMHQTNGQRDLEGPIQLSLLAPS